MGHKVEGYASHYVCRGRTGGRGGVAAFVKSAMRIFRYLSTSSKNATSLVALWFKRKLSNGDRCATPTHLFEQSSPLPVSLLRSSLHLSSVHSTCFTIFTLCDRVRSVLFCNVFLWTSMATVCLIIPTMVLPGCSPLHVTVNSRPENWVISLKCGRKRRAILPKVSSAPG